MISTIRVRTWHVALVLALASALVAGALATTSHQAASKPVNAGVPLSAPAHEPIPAYDGYKGWGQVSGGFYGNTFAPAQPKTAWEWNARYGWMQRGRTPGTRVYIWPYAAGWSWTWTESTGWYAMQTKDLQIGFRPIAIAT